MADLSKLLRLVDDPEVRVLIYGLTHGGPAVAGAGPGRLHGLVGVLIDGVTVEQRRSWLSDRESNAAVSVEQVQAVLGPDAIDDVARYCNCSAYDAAFQLSVVLPDLVDALSPGGVLVGADELARELAAASAADDRSAGPFGPHVH
jgi:uncharacterized protein YidB (DUF937 family)